MTSEASAKEGCQPLGSAAADRPRDLCHRCGDLGHHNVAKLRCGHIHRRSLTEAAIFSANRRRGQRSASQDWATLPMARIRAPVRGAGLTQAVRVVPAGR